MSQWRQTILTVLMLLSSLVPSLSAKTYWVDPSGAFSSIRAALAHATDGDTLHVAPGIYREGAITIDKSIHVIGHNLPQIDGEGTYQIITVVADSVHIEGLHLMNVGVSFTQDNAAIKCDAVEGCVIENNTISNGFFGIYLAKSANCVVKNNQIKGEAVREVNSGNGIHLWYCKNILIEGNTVRQHRDGIYFEFVEHGTVRNNLSEKNLRYGLHFMFSHHCRYEQNQFQQNGAGVAVMYTQDVHMVNNRFQKNWGAASFGLLLKDIRDSEITQNHFVENTVGIYAEACDRVVVSENRFEQNGWAIKLMANSMDNTFRRNNFLVNTFDVATNSRQNFNTFEGNYWSTYRGYDLDQDDVGDVPFRPVRLFSLIVEKQPPALILLRSSFIGLLDIAERVFPVLTPETLIDPSPAMMPVTVE